MKLDQAIKLAIVTMENKRRQYAPEAKCYEYFKDPALESEYLRYKELDDAIKQLKELLISPKQKGLF